MVSLEIEILSVIIKNIPMIQSYFAINLKVYPVVWNIKKQTKDAN